MNVLLYTILLFGGVHSMYLGSSSAAYASYRKQKLIDYDPGKKLRANEIVYKGYNNWREMENRDLKFLKIQGKCLGRGTYGTVYRIVKTDGTAKTVGKFFSSVKHAQDEWLNYQRILSKNVKHVLQPTGLYRVEQKLAKDEYRFHEFDEESGKHMTVQRDFFMEMKECIPLTEQDIVMNPGKFVSEIMSAHNELYSNGWSHLDIKRQNLMWSAEKLVFIDLGTSIRHDHNTNKPFFGNRAHSSPYANRMNKFVLDLYTFRYSDDMIAQELKMNDFWSMGSVMADAFFGDSFHQFMEHHIYEGKRGQSYPRYEALSPRSVEKFQKQLNSFLDRNMPAKLRNTFVEECLYGALTIDPFLREVHWKNLYKYIGYYSWKDLVLPCAANLKKEMSLNLNGLTQKMKQLEKADCFRNSKFHAYYENTYDTLAGRVKREQRNKDLEFLMREYRAFQCTDESSKYDTSFATTNKRVQVFEKSNAVLPRNMEKTVIRNRFGLPEQWNREKSHGKKRRFKNTFNAYGRIEEESDEEDIDLESISTMIDRSSVFQKRPQPPKILRQVQQCKQGQRRYSSQIHGQKYDTSLGQKIAKIISPASNFAQKHRFPYNYNHRFESRPNNSIGFESEMLSDSSSDDSLNFVSRF